MVDRSQMRASDADRERVADMLRDAHTEGRLTQEELLDRIEIVYGSRTFTDLDGLIHDLPVVRRPPSALTRRAPGTQAAPADQARRGFQRVVRGTLTTFWWIWAFAVAVNTTVWLVLGVSEGAAPYPWPLWVAGPWGIVLVTLEALYRRWERGSASRPSQ